VRLCVCVKEVPSSLVSLRLDPDSRRLVRGKGRLNAPDVHALEEALRLRDEAGDGEVVLVSMAPEHAVDALRHGLAMGADRASLIADPALAGSDLVVTARVLAAALERERPDLILFGWESSDSGGAMLWAAVGERLGLPVLSRVWELRTDDGTVWGRRQMEYGFDVVQAALPCAVAISGAINAPRHPSLKGLVASKRTEVDRLSVADLGLAPSDVGETGARTRVLGLRRPPEREHGTMIEDGEHAAEQLIEHLVERGVL
jgi:electron transfer flavoprotein beta subunit